MKAVVKQLIGTLKQSIEFVELRTTHESECYFEAVLLRPHLSGCCDRLQQGLGRPLKSFDESVKFEPTIQRAVAFLGGVRIDQCLFFARGEGQQVAYAALWPWTSDATRITLKVGLLELT